MGINLLLDISRQSFAALDAAMNVTAQNVSNVETPGFHRRRLDLNSIEMGARGLMGASTTGPVGGGVTISGYSRVRDVLLDHARWEARGSLAYANEQERVLSVVESLFPNGNGSLAETIDKFWNSWSDLADHPTDVGVRLTVRGQAETLVRKLNDLDGNLDRVSRESVETLRTKVDESNRLLREIGDLNVYIAHARRSGNPDVGSEDSRDLKITRLAELLPAQFEEQPDGTTNVYVRGMSVVQLGEVTQMELEVSAGNPTLTFGTSNVTFKGGTDAGEIGALMGPVLTGINQTRDELDAMTEAIVTAVNTQHRAGFAMDGSTGHDFFNASGLAAGSIELSSTITADATMISGSGDAAAPGDNANALAIHDLRYARLLNGGAQTVSDFAVDVVSRVGAGVASAKARAIGSESTVAGLDAMARGVSGVSIDDEMVGLIKLQQAYAATARLLSTADSMFDTLLAI